MESAKYLPVAGSWEGRARKVPLGDEIFWGMYSASPAGAQLLGTAFVAATAQAMPTLAGVHRDSPARCVRVAA